MRVSQGDAGERRELLLLQGREDAAVPVEQAESMAEAMRAAGRAVEIRVYDGEGHGFRRRETLVDALEREIAFYARVMGPSAAGR